MKKIFRLVPIFLICMFVIGCGYKPTSYYAKKQIGERVYVDLYVNIEDPKNSVLIKDSVNEKLSARLGATLVSLKSQADTFVTVKLNSVALTQTQYDESGFTKLYTVKVTVNTKVINKGKTNSFNVTGRYDFSIDDSSTISETKRFDAIAIASNRAMDLMLSKLAILSFKND